jgi:hypothetical protein
MLKLKKNRASANLFLDVFYILLLFLLTFKFTNSLETIKDIDLYDETLFYLDRGVNLFKHGIPEAPWGPLYAIWYFFLSLFEHDNIVLFYLNFKLLIITTSSLLYIYLRTLQIRPVISVIFGFIYSISTISLVTPRPGNFSVLIFLFFLVIANYTKNNIRFYFITAFAFLSISFIRPEYTISFLMIFSMYLVLLIRSIFSQTINIKNEILRLFTLLTLILLLVLSIGNPLTGGRSLIAFAEHYGFLWMFRNDAIVYDHDTEYYISIFYSVFGDVDSISQALMVNPKEFLIHIKINCISYLHRSFSILLVDFQNDFHASVNLLIRRIEMILLAIVILFISVRLKLSYSRIDYKVVTRLLMILISILIPVFLSSFLIHPRFHYLILQSVFILIIIAYLLENSLPIENQKIKNKKLLYSIFISVILFILTPNLATGWCWTENFCIIPRVSTPETSRLPVLKTIKFIQSLQIEGEVNVLQPNRTGYHVYLGDRYHYIYETQKQEDFAKFLKNEKINMIILTPRLAHDTGLVGDKEFINFIEKPQQWNFIKLKIPKTEVFLFLSSDLIDRKNYSVK